jgi:hypothetical protein
VTYTRGMTLLEDARRYIDTLNALQIDYQPKDFDTISTTAARVLTDLVTWAENVEQRLRQIEESGTQST